MEVSHKRQGYILHKVTDDNVLLCKILKEYNSIDEAQEGLVDLLTGNITEKKIIKSNKYE